MRLNISNIFFFSWISSSYRKNYFFRSSDKISNLKYQLGQLSPFASSEENYWNIFLRIVAHVLITRSYLLFLGASANEVTAKLSGPFVSTVSIVERYTSLTFETSKQYYCSYYNIFIIIIIIFGNNLYMKISVYNKRNF